MSGLVYFNGILVPESEVALSLKDRSYLYGEGLFETMKAEKGFIPFLQEHLSRLFGGVDLLNLNVSISLPKLEFSIEQTLLHNHLKDAYIRVNLSQESEEHGDFHPGQKTNLAIIVKPLKKAPARLYRQGATAKIYGGFRIHPDVFCAIKSANYLRYLLARRDAEKAGADEALLLNTQGRLVEGATTNFFLHDGSRWITPPLAEGPLAGVTRGVLLDMMRKNDVPVEEKAIAVEELRGAAEAILTNAIREIIPLSRVDDLPIGRGEVGAETRRLMELYQEEVQFRRERFESRMSGVEDVL
jgi:branched-chain amino acid aminotransferase